MKDKILLSMTLWLFLAMMLFQQPIHVQAQPTSPTETLTGRMVSEEIYAPVLEGALLNPSTNREVLVYLPPDYDALPEARFPVVYLLHDWSRTPSLFLSRMGGQSNLDAFFNQKGALQAIIVIPDTYYRYQGSWFTNSYVAGNWQDFITDDLVSYIDNTYRTFPEARSRGIAGVNTGGYGAIKLGMLRPDLFQVVYAMTPAELAFEDVFLVQFRQNINRVAADPTQYANFNLNNWQEKVVVGACVEFAPDSTATPLMCNLPVDSNGVVIDSLWQQWLRNDPYTLLNEPEYRQNLLDLKGLAIDCATGSVNRYVINANRLFHLALTDAGIEHVYAEYPGEFPDSLESRMRDVVLPFFSAPDNGKLDGIIRTATEAPPGIPDEYHLSQNYPNPFNPVTTITYALPQPSDVTLAVFDVLGRRVFLLTSGMKPAGQYHVSFDAVGLASGLYLYRLQAGNYVETKRMVVMR